jgi:hypothetical protein
MLKESLRRALPCLQMAQQRLSASNDLIDIDSGLDAAVEWLKSLEVCIIPHI